MALVWNPYGLVGLAALALGWIAGAMVYAAAPKRAANRLLALVLILEGTGVGLARGVNAFHDDRAASLGFSAVTATCAIFGPILYLMFYSRLDSRLARLLRSWPVVALASVATVAGFVYFLLRIEELRTLYFRAFYTWTAFGLLGMVVALTAWAESPAGSVRRRQAKAYAIAFAVRDIGWFAYFWWIVPAFQPAPGTTHPFWTPFFGLFAPSITIAFILLLAYGILRTQLFDIDLRLKVGLRRSTVAAVFLGVFFVVAQVGESFLQTRLGWIAGAVAAGLMLFALTPLHRAAQTFADATMPGVKDTAEYRTVRKREVYRAAAESALSDGVVSTKERDVLATLADHLGLTSREALELEREAGAARG